MLGLGFRIPGLGVYRVAVTGLDLSYCIGETKLITLYTHYGKSLSGLIAAQFRAYRFLGLMGFWAQGLGFTGF